MSQSLQILRTVTNNAPGPLNPGELSAELAPGAGFTKLWIGAAGGNRLLISNNPAENPLSGAGYLKLSGGTLTGALTLSGPPTLALHAATMAYALSQAQGDARYLQLVGGTLTGALNLPAANPTTNPEATHKLYVDTQDQVLQNQIDALANNLVFVGQLDVPNDAADFTAASGITDGPLPAPSAALLGRYVIVTAGGGPPAGNIPPGTYAQHDWLVCDATPAWVHLELGAATYVAADIAISPAIGALGANVQTGLTWLEANTVQIAGDTMTGLLVLSGPPTIPLHAATKAYADTMLPLAGGTMLGLLTLSGPPTVPLHAATKAYVDALPLAVVTDGSLTGAGTVGSPLSVLAIDCGTY
jgi:hypothetical protein